MGRFGAFPDDRTMTFTTPAIHRDRSRVAVHVVGAIATVIGSIVAFGASTLVAFGNSYCGDAATPDKVQGLHHGLLVIGLALAAVPALTAVVAWRVRALPYVWIAVSALIVLFTFVVAFQSKPGSWCYG